MLKLRKNKLNYTVFEHNKLAVGSFNDPNRHTIDKKTYEEINQLTAMSGDINGDNIENFIEIGWTKGTQFIKFNNYVGCFALPSGITFEILPKTYGSSEDYVYARQTVLKMLEMSSYVSFKSKKDALVGIEKIPIFEIYIALFITEVDRLVKRGLKSSYIAVEENSNTLNGKLLFAKQVLYNNCHGEKFYVEHDLYDINRPENKVIKSALLLLKNKSRNDKNLSNIKRLLLNLDSIEPSSNVREDISKCIADRTVSDYKEAIRYAKVFLLGYSFSVYSGKENNISLLFPAELLYQEYVFQHVKRALVHSGYDVRRQDTSTYLFTEPRKFQLRPDIVVSKNDETIILDTKWKLIEKESDISQADVYQMYVYHKRYPNVKKVILLYPLISPNNGYRYKSLENVLVKAEFVKLLIEDNKPEFSNLLNIVLTDE